MPLLTTALLAATTPTATPAPMVATPGSATAQEKGAPTRLPPTTTTIRKPLPQKSLWSEIWAGPSLGLGYPRLGTVGGSVKVRDWFKLSGDYGTIPGDYDFQSSSWGVTGSWFFVPIAHLSLGYGQQTTSFRKRSSGKHPLDDSGGEIAFDVERKAKLSANFLVASVGYFVPIGPLLFFECELGWYAPLSEKTDITTNEERIPADFSNRNDMKQSLRDADKFVKDFVSGGKPYLTLTRLHFLF